MLKNEIEKNIKLEILSKWIKKMINKKTRDNPSYFENSQKLI